jgi:hypothetical protein
MAPCLLGNLVNKGRVSENAPSPGNLVKEEREEDRPQDGPQEALPCGGLY